MKSQHFGIASIGVGVLLLVGSVAWSAVPNDAIWNAEQAHAYATAASTFHDHTFDKSITKEEMQVTRQEYELRREEYDQALAMKTKSPTYLRVAGLVFTALGIALIKMPVGGNR